MLLKGGENFQYNSFHSNLSELDVYVVNRVLILIRLFRNSHKLFLSTWEYFLPAAAAAAALGGTVGALLAEKGKPRSWGKAGKFDGLHLKRKLQWSVNYLSFP